MSKVDEYIKKYTRHCSNVYEFQGKNSGLYREYEPWLTPFHAEAVAQIAREEVIEKACEYFIEHCGYIDTASYDLDDVINNFRKAMEE